MTGQMIWFFIAIWAEKLVSHISAEVKTNAASLKALTPEPSKPS